MPVSLTQVVDYLNRYLRVAEAPDDPRAVNGIQVENSGTVSKLAAAVDACQATIDGAAQQGADFLIVHHGLFWGGVEPVVGRHARRLRSLLQHDVALYAAHLPLDAHPEVGNNAVLARLLGVADTEPFGEVAGAVIGVAGRLDVARDRLMAQLCNHLGHEPKLLPGGPVTVRRVGIVTGAASSLISAAKDAGLDTFVTGEGPHHTYFDAEEWGLNVIYAGHYATETVGVKALGEHVARRFDLPWIFVDHPTGL